MLQKPTKKQKERKKSSCTSSSPPHQCPLSSNILAFRKNGFIGIRCERSNTPLENMNGCCSTWGAHHFGFTRRPSSLLGRTLPRGGGGEVAHGPPAVGARSTPSSATTTTTSASPTRSTAAGYTSNTEEVEKLQKGIAELYDESSRVWEEIWGDHMHHGFYDPNYNTNKNDNNDALSLLSDHRSAQIRMIEESLRFAGVSGDNWFYSLFSSPSAIFIW